MFAFNQLSRASPSPIDSRKFVPQQKKIDSMQQKIVQPEKISNKTSTEVLKSLSVHSSLKKFMLIKNKAIRAINEGKIFIIVGTYPVIRKELQKRGWVEKIITPNAPESMPKLETLLEFADEKNDFERQILSNLVADYPADFVFGNGYARNLKYVHDFTIWNNIILGQEKNFCRKDGLCECLCDIHFYTIENFSEVCTPRSFNIRNKFLKNFKEEYHFTMGHGLLNFISCYGDINSNPKLDVSRKILKLAKYFDDTIKMEREHGNLDGKLLQTKMSEEEWEEISKLQKEIVHYEEPFSINQKVLLYVIEVIQKVHKHWPWLIHDGFNNLWLFKPSNLCAGNGIKILNTWESIESVANAQIENFVLQKYIEKPLLIHKTKFDIRYFFLLIIRDGFLQLWDFPICYLRFSSEEFNLNDLREKIHLTNHSIQMKYKNGIRSEKLPQHNMWNLTEFREYLESINEGDKWKSKIYPAIKKNLIGICMLGMENIDFKPNRFQIFGADFLITDDFFVYLLEVNGKPAIHTNPTVVTKDIFRQVCEDSIKGLIKFFELSSSP